MYCPADSTLICVDCKDVGIHKGHPNLLSLHEAAVKKTAELQSLIDRVDAAQKLEYLTNAISQARASAAEKFNAARTRLEEFISHAQNVQNKINEKEREANAAFDGQASEIMRAREALRDVKTQALKVCEGNKGQILQAPKIEFIHLEILDSPCVVLRKYRLVLPDISQMKIECQMDVATRRAPIEDAIVQRNFSKGQRVDVLEPISGSWQTAVIARIAGDRCMIHYDGWSSSWDEWVPLDSFRLCALGAHT